MCTECPLLLSSHHKINIQVLRNIPTVSQKVKIYIYNGTVLSVLLRYYCHITYVKLKYHMVISYAYIPLPYAYIPLPSSSLTQLPLMCFHMHICIYVLPYAYIPLPSSSLTQLPLMCVYIVITFKTYSFFSFFYLPILISCTMFFDDKYLQREITRGNT